MYNNELETKTITFKRNDKIEPQQCATGQK